jgi:dihydrofolate reductase
VFPRTLERIEWNSRLMKGDIPGKIRELKQGKGKDMVLFARADIAGTFIKHDLIDEYRLIVNPVVLGKGTPLFKPEGLSGKTWVNLKLTQSRSFECGNILLCYEPQK